MSENENKNNEKSPCRSRDMRALSVAAVIFAVAVVLGARAGDTFLAALDEVEQ